MKYCIIAFSLGVVGIVYRCHGNSRDCLVRVFVSPQKKIAQKLIKKSFPHAVVSRYNIPFFKKKMSVKQIIRFLSRFIIDFSELTLFEQKVLWKTKLVRYGTVASYKKIAHALGSPYAARAVGNALNKNPFPLIIPCHRIIASDGRIGGFAAGIHFKRMILREEGIHL